MSMSFETAKRAKRRAVERVPIVLDQEWGVEMGQAQIRLSRLQQEAHARPGDTSLLPQIEDVTENIDRLNALKDEKVLTFVFRSISPYRYEQLIAAHPPTKEQRTRAEREGRRTSFNENTLPPALVHACMTSPDWSLDEVNELWSAEQHAELARDVDDDEAEMAELWSSAELGALFQGAQMAQITRPQVG